MTHEVHHHDVDELEITGVVADDHITGERFGKYILVGEIAVGGMAEVFLGVKKGLEGFLKVVVLKRVLPHFSDNSQFVRMFVDEARLAARLDHPNIVRTYEFGEVNGQYFTVMEYLPGEDLRSILRRLSHAKQNLPLHVAVGIVAQVCAGLHCAHQLTDTAGRPLNLVHRDINPANIIITYGGEVKIIDFGVAKTNATATVAGTIKGKIAYMPPEQMLGTGVDQRSDIFSAGVVLWELLTGRRLFGRTSDAATLYAIMNAPIPLPSRYRPEVPRELDAIVARALSRTSANRYDSAEEMAEELEQFIASQPKYDARVMAGIVEQLFGWPRAEAKRAIAQTRSLSQNISLVMKLRSEVRAELVQSARSLATGSGTNNAAPQVEPEPRSLFAMLLGVVMVVGIAGGIAFATAGSSGPSGPSHASAAEPAHGSLHLDSEPSGAAISIGGEPTGLKTPASVAVTAASRITIRLELPGYATIAQTIDVPETGTFARRIALVPVGRLVLADLPRGATLLVDGTEYPAGEVVAVGAGRHAVQVNVGGKPIAKQELETTTGDQVWKLAGDRLVQD